MNIEPNTVLITVKVKQAGYRPVYKGGHTTTWCNGSQHFHSEGGYAVIYDQNPKNIRVMREKPYMCNCAYFNNYKGQP